MRQYPSVFLQSYENDVRVTGVPNLAFPATPAISELPPLATGTVGVPNPVGRFPYTEQFSVGAQRQVASNMAISADFVHTLGLHFPRSYNVNARQPDGSYPLVANGRIMNVNDYGNRIHGNQLQVRLESAPSEQSVLPELVYVPASVPIPKRARRQAQSNADYGPATNDVRHRVVLSGVYTLPFAIQLGGVLTASSAAPYTIITGFDTNGDRDVNERPIVDGKMIPPNSARGDSYFDTDLRISKRFNVGSRQLEILWEMFNLFNTKNFGGYQGNERSVLFGQPTFALAPFQGQLGFRFDF